MTFDESRPVSAATAQRRGFLHFSASDFLFALAIYATGGAIAGLLFFVVAGIAIFPDRFFILLLVVSVFGTTFYSIYESRWSVREHAEIKHHPLGIIERILKRILDIVVTGIALAALFPLLLFCAIAITLDSPGPVLFRQIRVGFNGRPFYIYKFRTLTVIEDDEYLKQGGPIDFRVTRVGSWLRRTSIDELPQLINVLHGEMSVVGPRPLTTKNERYYISLANYAFRHHVKPGITGWAQLHGYRLQPQTDEAIQKRIELDLWYMENWTIWLDIKILYRTAIEIIKG